MVTIIITYSSVLLFHYFMGNLIIRFPMENKGHLYSIGLFRNNAPNGIYNFLKLL